MQLAGKALRRAEAALEAGNARIAVHQQAIVVVLEALGDLCLAPGFRLDQVSHGANDQWTLLAFGCHSQQWQELEAHLAPTKGKQLDQQHIRRGGRIGGEQRFAPPTLPGIVHRVAVLIEQLLEGRIARRRRQLQYAISLDRPSTACQRDLEASLLQRLRQRGGAPQVAYAQEMLDVEENLHLTFKRSTRGAPASSTMKRCTASHSSFAGGLPRMSQPVASANSARITPRCVTARVGSPACATSFSHVLTLDSTRRGLSPPGGLKSRPRASLSRIAAPSRSRSAANDSP